MNLLAKKLEFIEEYIRLADEGIILKLEKLLHAEKEKAAKQGLKPYTQKEMENMIGESEIDIQQGNVLTHDAIKQEVLNWRTSGK